MGRYDGERSQYDVAAERRLIKAQTEAAERKNNASSGLATLAVIGVLTAFPNLRKFVFWLCLLVLYSGLGFIAFRLFEGQSSDGGLFFPGVAAMLGACGLVVFWLPSMIISRAFRPETNNNVHSHATGQAITEWLACSALIALTFGSIVLGYEIQQPYRHGSIQRELVDAHLVGVWSDSCSSTDDRWIAYEIGADKLPRMKTNRSGFTINEMKRGQDENLFLLRLKADDGTPIVMQVRMNLNRTAFQIIEYTIQRDTNISSIKNGRYANGSASPIMQKCISTPKA